MLIINNNHMEENKSNNKIIIISAIIAILVGGGAFYSGMRYEQSKAATGLNAQGSGRFQGMRANGAVGNQPGGNRAVGGNVLGEIIKQDNKSVTLKLLDGGSKIIYYTDTTNVSKTASGTKADLIVGENVSVVGTTNSDGSVIAQTVQIRPAGENRPRPPRQ
jgi:hypothetical protein